jgi:hypothetical protein
MQYYALRKSKRCILLVYSIGYGHHRQTYIYAYLSTKPIPDEPVGLLLTNQLKRLYPIDM